MASEHTDALDPGQATKGDIIDLQSVRTARSEESVPLRSPPPKPQVTFHRTELDRILRVYGRKVAEGEWRDYAIDFGPDRAIFSCFRRASEMPQYRIVKDPKLTRKQGAWSVLSAAGATLKRGRELEQVLRLFDRKPKVVR